MMRLTILLDPAGITGKRVSLLDPELTLQQNIARAMPLGAAGCELRINGVTVDPLSDPRMHEPPRPSDEVVLVSRPEGPETWLLIASFIFAVVSYSLVPKPEVPPISSESPNNRLTGQTNIARAYQAIPDVYGRRRVWPDLIQPTLVEYVDNVRTLTETLCVSRGIGGISGVRFAETDLADINGATWQAFYPTVAGPVPPGMPAGYAESLLTEIPDVYEPFQVADVDGQEMSVTTTPGIVEQSAVLETNDTTSFTLTFADSAEFDTLKSLAPSGTARLSFAYTTGGSPPELNVFDGNVTVEDYEVLSGQVTFSFLALTTLPGTAAGQTTFATVYAAATTTNAIGPFTLPVQCDQIWFNVAFLRGLQGTVQIEAEWWEIDANGDEVPATREDDTWSFTDTTNDQRFYTRKITPTGGLARYKIQFSRITADLANGADTAKLESVTAVRYYATKQFPGVTVIRLTTRATEEATSSRERRFNLLWQRHVRTLSSDTISPSRNFARAMAHLWTISGESIAELDTATLQALNTQHGENSALLRFDGSLDDADMSLGERMQLIANHARCVMWRDGQLWTVTRDQRRDLVEMQLDYRNLAAAGDSVINVGAHLPASEDGVEVEYVDEASGTKKAYVRLNISTGAPMSGSSRTPRRVVLPGCTTQAQAENRAQLEARKLLLQRTSVTDRALGDGAMLGPGSLVRWVDPADFYGDDGVQAGEVLAIDGTTLTTSEPVQWGGETLGRVLFTGDDGAYLSAPVQCSPGATPFELELAASPPAGLYVRDDDRQLGSRYAVAVGVTASELEMAGLYSVVDSKPQGDGTYALALVNYNRRVYSQDPDYGVYIEAGIGAAVASGPAAEVGDGTLRIAAGVGAAASSGDAATLTLAGPINGANFSDGAVNGYGGEAIAGVRFRTTGAVAQAQGAGATWYADYSLWHTGTVSSSWWVRFTTTASSGGTLSGSGGGWLALSSDRTVTLTAAALGIASATVGWEVAADSGGSDIRAAGSISLNANSTE